MPRPTDVVPAADARRRIRAWCLYDWANSAFACTVMAAMYPPFFRGLATAAGVPVLYAYLFIAWGGTIALAAIVIEGGS